MQKRSIYPVVTPGRQRNEASTRSAVDRIRQDQRLKRSGEKKRPNKVYKICGRKNIDKEQLTDLFYKTELN